MRFLVYTAEPLDDNATLESFQQDNAISRIVDILNDMDPDRVLTTETVGLFVEDVEYDSGSEIVTADIYKLANPGTALHQIKREGDERTVQEILSEHEDAFAKGILGVKKIDGKVYFVVQSKFGSYFHRSCKGMRLTPQYSSETIQSVIESDTIGKTSIDFADDYDLTASLFKPPEDEDIREDDGFGKVDALNKLMEIMKISRSHRITLDIKRDEWISYVEVFEKLIESGIVSTVRVKDTKNGIVKLGEGGDRAIRKKIDTTGSRDQAVEEAFLELDQ